MGEWQPIESAPKDGTYVLAWHSRLGYTVAYWGRKNSYNHAGWLTKPQSINHIDQPTHWQPLPEPPRVEAKGG